MKCGYLHTAVNTVLKGLNLVPFMCHSKGVFTFGWDNAPVERFFCSLKREWTGHRLYRTQLEAMADVREYVAVYYNFQRLHSTLGYTTPMNYEKDLNKVSGNG